MDEREQKLAKAFANSGEMYEFIKNNLLEFGKIDTDCSDAELGARYKAREELKKEIRLKFKAYELLN